MNNILDVYSNDQMLKWLGYLSETLDIDLEKIKLLNICNKKKNVLPTIETKKRLLIFANESHKNLFYEMWEAGLGDCEVYYGKGLFPGGEIKHKKAMELTGREICEPTVILIINENARETYKIGINNENFSRGPIHYVGSEIRAVIMSLLHVDSQDCLCFVSAESIAIEAAIIAGEGTIIAVEGDPGSRISMEENVSKFGVNNVEIVSDLTANSLAPLPKPRLAFIVATENLEKDIQNLLAKNPKLQIVVYTLELDILSQIKGIFERHNIEDMEVLQITISKTDKNSVFITQPSPWLITGTAVLDTEE